MTDEKIRRIEDRVAILERDTAVIRSDQKHISDGVDSIKDTMTWLVRLITGALVLAVVGFVVNGGLVL